MSRSFRSPRVSPRPGLVSHGSRALLVLLALTACSGSPPAPRVEGVPAWLPVYPDSEVQPLFEAATEPQGIRGAVSFRIPAEAGEAVQFYRDRFEAAHFEVRVSPFRSDAGRGARIEGGDSKTGFHAIVSQEDDGTCSAVFNYTTRAR